MMNRWTWHRAMMRDNALSATLEEDTPRTIQLERGAEMLEDEASFLRPRILPGREDIPWGGTFGRASRRHSACCPAAALFLRAVWCKGSLLHHSQPGFPGGERQWHGRRAKWGGGSRKLCRTDPASFIKYLGNGCRTSARGCGPIGILPCCIPKSGASRCKRRNSRNSTPAGTHTPQNAISVTTQGCGKQT